MFRFAAVGLCALIVSGSVALAGPYDEDFNDNSQSTMWTKVEDDPSKASVSETNQQLEVYSHSAVTYNADALYLSNGPTGFALSTASDFQIRIDYNFGSTSSTSASGETTLANVNFGLGTDVSGVDSLAIGYGFGGQNPIIVNGFFAAYRVANVQSSPSFSGSASTSGTFYISYDASGDTIYLSNTGYGAGNALVTYDDIVQAQWGASEVLVSFGGRYQRAVTNDTNTWLDNFVIDQGDVSPVPEPGTLALLACGGLAMAGALRRRRR